MGKPKKNRVFSVISTEDLDETETATSVLHKTLRNIHRKTPVFLGKRLRPATLLKRDFGTGVFL